MSFKRPGNELPNDRGNPRFSSSSADVEQNEPIIVDHRGELTWYDLPDGVQCCAVSDKNNLVFCGTGNKLAIIKLEVRRDDTLGVSWIRQFDSDRGRITAINCNSTGDRFVTGYENGYVALWRMPRTLSAQKLSEISETPYVPIKPFDDAVISVKFTTGDGNAEGCAFATKSGKFGHHSFHVGRKELQGEFTGDVKITFRDFRAQSSYGGVINRINRCDWRLLFFGTIISHPPKPKCGRGGIFWRQTLCGDFALEWTSSSENNQNGFSHVFEEDWSQRRVVGIFD